MWSRATSVGWNIAVGLVWGFTNPLIARGSARAADKEKAWEPSSTQSSAPLRALAAFWASLLSTPSFWLPQAANWCGSAAFVAGLGRSALSTAPLVANSTCLAANAAADALLLGHRSDARLLLPGVALVAAGVFLCATS